MEGGHSLLLVFQSPLLLLTERPFSSEKEARLQKVDHMMIWYIYDTMTPSNFIIKYILKFNCKIVTLDNYWVIHYFQLRIRCPSQAGNHKPRVSHLADKTNFWSNQKF